MSDVTVDDPWADVIGQPVVVDTLRAAAAGDPPHAWLFAGPIGSGKRAAARVFAGELLAAEPEAAGDEAGAARARSLARAEQHPDLIVVAREGASISVDQARDIVKRASRSAQEGSRKVMLLEEFHLVAGAAPTLLKSIEEPEAGTFFVILAEHVPEELVTIASRCVRLDFSPLAPEVVVEQLVAEGVDRERAVEVGASAGGDLERARLLATDERLAIRLAAWRDLPRRLDGTGARAAGEVAELRAAIDDAAAPLAARHEAEVVELDERIERYGMRGSGAKDLQDRHKREMRRLRADELRMGLTALARTYRDELAVSSDPAPLIAAVEAIDDLGERLIRNPNEELQLVALALRLPTLA